MALLRARAAVAAPPPIQLRLSSLRSLRLRILPPQGGKGKIELSPRQFSARLGFAVVDLDGEAAILDGLFLRGDLGDHVGRDLAVEGAERRDGAAAGLHEG